MLRDNKGITLIALTIIVIVLLIISGIAITGGNESLKMTKTNKLLTELDMVQHACLERYSEWKLTKDDSLIIGEEMPYEQVETIANNMGGATVPEGKYYKLVKDKEHNKDDLIELGLTTEENVTYIVNYEYGVVINLTTQKTPTGEKTSTGVVDKYLIKTTN